MQRQARGIDLHQYGRSFFQESYRLLASFLKTKELARKPASRFFGGSARASNYLHTAYLDEKNLIISRLNSKSEKEIVQHLYRKRYF